jgi:hypothetical protein
MSARVSSRMPRAETWCSTKNIHVSKREPSPARSVASRSRSCAPELSAPRSRGRALALAHTRTSTI